MKSVARATTRFTVRVLADWRELEPLKPDWEELAATALEPSPSAEWWMLIPALRHELPGEGARVALIFVSDSVSPPERTMLCGVFPIEERARFRGLPTRVIRIWSHFHTLYSVPLLRREYAADCVRAFLGWVDAEHPAHTIVHFPELRTESEFFRVLDEVVRQDGYNHLVADIWARALFRPKANADRYVQSLGTAHHRKEWRRQERRLSETGTLTYDSLNASHDVQTWLDEFIALEMSGWKGNTETAIGCSDKHRAWLAEVAAEAFERGRLMMLALRLDGKAVAMRLNFLAPPGSYAFKIAFDEQLLKYSPGVLLELENIRRLHTMPEIEWMDSIAAPNHPLMDRVWPERTGIVSLLIAPGHVVGQILVGAIPLLQVIKRLCKGPKRKAGATPSDPGA